jgi:hypothetical protein
LTDRVRVESLTYNLALKRWRRTVGGTTITLLVGAAGHH